jgi:hypothetical protein
VNDVSSNGNDDTTAGNPVYVTGQIGKVIDLDGSDQRLERKLPCRKAFGSAVL